jgi:preflagellin peptidase FlaK
MAYGVPEVSALAAFLPLFAIATAYDLRERRIPNAVNFAFLTAGVALTVYFKWNTPEYFAGYFAFVAASFAFAYVLYKLGAWAGGDVKFFLALGSLYPLAKNASLSNAFDFLAILVIFVFAALAIVPVLVAIALKKSPGITAPLKGYLKDALAGAAKAAPFSAALIGVLNAAFNVNILLFLAIAATSFFVKLPFFVGVVFFAAMLFFETNATLAALPLSFAAIALVAFSIKSFPECSAKVLRRKLKISEVKEGDIPAYTIYLDGKGKPRIWRPGFSAALKAASEGRLELAPKGRVVANSLAARGLTNAEIRKLKALGIKALEVKETTPFAPALGIGWLLTVLLF